MCEEVRKINKTACVLFPYLTPSMLDITESENVALLVYNMFCLAINHVNKNMGRSLLAYHILHTISIIKYNKSFDHI